MNREATAPAPARPRSGRLIPLAVVAAILLAVTVPRVLDRGKDDLAPLQLPSVPAPAQPVPDAATWPAEARQSRRTLVLYDRTGRWGWLGELYATMTANLVGHFGPSRAKPVAEYRAGDMNDTAATIYIGSTYGERLPRPFLADVLAARRPVLWLNANIWQLARHAPGFAERYGWRPGAFDRTPVASVRYGGQTLTRRSRRAAGVMTYAELDRARARVLGEAVRGDGTSFPWAVRSRNLTYVGEIPFPYTSETDRVLAFADLLFGLLAPGTPERHRALVRLEDIDPTSDPEQLRAAADYLHSEGIPFGFGVVPRYRDPTGSENDGEPRDVLLRDSRDVVAAIRYMQRKGGVLVEHGYTHEWDGGPNPYNGATGDDVEFYRVTEGAQHQVRYDGPLPGDTSPAWADRRIAFANREFEAAGIGAPAIFEFPHYAASANAYAAARRRFATRWERSFYFAGVLSGGRIDHRRQASQFFPYVVRDVYGSKVLPENLGSVNPVRWHTYRPRLPEEILRAARANLVVRDGFASFFFHPFLDLHYLKTTVRGIRALGYTFVDPSDL